MLDRNMPVLDDIATGRCIDLLPLRVSGLSLTRDNEVLLRDINFEINNAGITLIMGPNGAGKSTFLQIGGKIPQIYTSPLQYEECM